MGEIALREKKFSQAINYFRNASSNSALPVIPLFRIALIQQSMGNLEKAQATYGEILDIEPGNAEASDQVAALKAKIKADRDAMLEKGLIRK
jgi:TolA-binding protein